MTDTMLMFETKTYMDCVMDNIAKEMSAKKEELIKQRIVKYAGEQFDYIADAQKIFPQIKCHLDDDKNEVWWYDTRREGEEPIMILKLAAPKIKWEDSGQRLTINQEIK